MPFHLPWVLEHPKEVTDLQWLIILVVGFVLVAWIVKTKIWPSMIQPHLTDRHTAIVQAADQVRSTMEETRSMRDDYASRLAGIEQETQARIQAALEESEGLREQILAEAQQTAHAIRRRGEEEVARERAKAMVTLRQEFVEDVIGAARYAAARSVGPDDHRRLIDEFVKSVGAKA